MSVPGQVLASGVRAAGVSSMAADVSDTGFQLYRAGVVLCGVLLLVLAAVRIGVSLGARAASAVLGVALLAYGGYLFRPLHNGERVEVYTFLFLLPLLMVGYLLYDRATTREADEAARAELAAEKAARRAAREAEAPQQPSEPE